MNPESYFKAAIASHNKDLKHYRRLSFLLAMGRLAVFLIALTLLITFWGNTIVVAITFLAAFVFFLVLVSKSTDVREKKNYFAEMVVLNELELFLLKEGTSERIANGEEYLDDEHYFNRDIDLFGEGSLFHLINRTATKSGRDYLAEQLNANKISGISERQEAVKELAAKVEWRQHYQVTASLMET